MNVDDLAQEIRRVDGNHDLGSGALAEALMPYLRARSSAPEAREEALGNLLAVIHGDGGHRALEVGVEQAAAEAEKIVARLLSSAPEASEGEAVGQVNALYASGFGRMRCIEWAAGDMPEVGTKLYTHPAAPSADKLREAMKTACDLLAERTCGHAARSPGQNARLVLEHALSTPDALKGDAK